MTYIAGAKSHAVFYTESTWGVKPASPTYAHIPVNDCGVRFRPEFRQSDPYTGEYQRRHSTKPHGMPSGPVSLSLYGWKPSGVSTSVAQYMLDWAYGSHEVNTLPSKGLQWAQGPDVANEEFLGLRVNSATLRGSDDTGVVEMDLDLMGKTSQALGSAQTIPNDRERLLDMLFADVTFSLDAISYAEGATTATPGTTSVDIKSFSLQVQHNLKVEYLNAFTPTVLIKTTRAVSLTIVTMKEATTYDVMNRAQADYEFNGVLTFQGSHNGTGSSGTDTKVTATFPRLQLLNVDQQGGKPDLYSQPLQFAVLKPDSAETDMNLAYSEV